MRTIVAFVIYVAIFLVVGGAIYFFLFFRPNTNRVGQLNQDMAAAHTELALARERESLNPQRLEDLERMGHELEQAQREWDNISREWHHEHLLFLPEVFDDHDIMERINRIAAPYSHNMSVDFLYSRPFGETAYNGDTDGLHDGIWLTPVNITFTASYNGLISILSGFAHEWVDNRVVEYTMQRNWNQWDVVLRLDVLTQTPHPYRNSEQHFNAEPNW